MKKNNSQNDYIMMIAAILLLILSGGVIWSFDVKNQSSRDASRISSPKIIGRASLTVDFGSGKTRVFEGEIVEGEALIDALAQASKAGSFSYRFDEKSNLATIDNFSVNKNKAWRWYLNNREINKPINEVGLKSGDKITIKYE